VLFETFLALFAALGTLFVVCFIIGRLLSPSPSDGLSVYSVVVVSGSAPGLQQSVLAAEALSRQNGSQIVLLDSGLDPEARQCAEILSRVSDIPLFSAGEAAECLLDSVGKK